MKHENSDCDETPGALKPLMIERDFFRQIAGPDDQQLREGEIGPKHVEREKKFAQIVQVTLVDEVGEWLAVGKHSDDNNHECHCRNGLAGNEHEAVNRGGP